MFVSMKKVNKYSILAIVFSFLTFVCVTNQSISFYTAKQIIKETRTQYDSATAENARLKRIISLWPEEMDRAYPVKVETVHVAFKPDTIFLKPARKW